MPGSKTSFKQLLAKGSTNPRVSVQGIKEQRARVQELKRDKPGGGATHPPAKKQAAAAAVGAAAPRVAAPVAPARAAAPEQGSSFFPAATFCGARKGFVYQSGELGPGYYADGSQGGVPLSGERAPPPSASTHPAATAGPSDAEAEAEADAAGGALPADFFENPQHDPKNKGKEVAATRKEQQLKEEMAAFEKTVAGDLQAAVAADAVELEDEAEASQIDQAVQQVCAPRGEAATRCADGDMWRSPAQVYLARRVDELRDRAAEARERVRAGAATDAAAGAAAAAGQEQSARGGGADGGGDGGDDSDDDDDDALAQLDWRAKSTS